MAECEHLARTSAYFDGELPQSEQASAIAHVATCAECQQLLGTAVSLDAAVAGAPRAPVRLRRRWAVVAGIAVAAAAAIVVWLVQTRPHPAPKLALALSPQRAIEARFTGEAFAPHRPYHALRGERAREQIPLAALAELEHRGDRRDLFAALTSSGDLARARDIAEHLPDDAATASDRAALALVTNDPEHALEHAYHAIDRDPSLMAAWWNLGLAARDLGLDRVAKDALGKIVEPGWREEAAAEIAALDRELAREEDGFDRFQQRGSAMLDGGAPIEVADVTTFPGWARIYYYDALRVARSVHDVDALRPIAGALDTASGTSTARAAADRVAASDFTVRSRFVERYRALVARKASAEDAAKLVDDLRAAGAPVADVYVGAAILAGQARTRLADLRAITASWHDPWFDLFVERERIAQAFPDHDLRAEPALVAAIAGCGDAWAMRCGGLDLDLAELLFATGRDEEADIRARAAVDAYRAAGAPALLHHARSFLAEIHRARGRFALARAGFDEVVRAVGPRDCNVRRYAEIGRAAVALAVRDLAAARALLPAPTPPEGCAPDLDLYGLATAVDLARLTSDPKDLAVARAWVEAARGDPSALVATARLGLAPDAASRLRSWLAAHPSDDHANDVLRYWGYATLISEAGARAAWRDVIALGHEAHPSSPAPCTMVASLDDERLTIAVDTGGQVTGETRPIAAAAGDRTATVSPSAPIVAALASCTSIAVIAPPPLHGRADLLPANLPWYFVGAAHRVNTPPRSAAVQVIDASPPAAIGLPPLPALQASREHFDLTVAGPSATPARVLTALATASYAELHVHGVAATADSDAAFLALSPDPAGGFALRADAIRSATVSGVIVLAACRAGTAASLSVRSWSLPDAFLAGGASAVIAADVPIPDETARGVFDELHHRLVAGDAPEVAVAAVRAAHAGSWAGHLMVFR